MANLVTKAVLPLATWKGMKRTVEQEDEGREQPYLKKERVRGKSVDRMWEEKDDLIWKPKKGNEKDKGLAIDFIILWLNYFSISILRDDSDSGKQA